MEPMPRALKALNWITGALFLAACYMVLFYAPREAVMGDVQRVFYFHVAAGWVGALAFLVTAVAGADAPAWWSGVGVEGLRADAARVHAPPHVLVSRHRESRRQS